MQTHVKENFRVKIRVAFHLRIIKERPQQAVYRY